MSRLRHAELRRFSDVVWELGSPISAAGLSNHLLRCISRLIDIDRVSYNEVSRSSGRLVRAHSLDEPYNPELVASLNAHINQHPDFPAPTKISDTLSQRQFRALGLYREHFKLYGIHYQLGASFALDAESKISFGLNRQKRDFTEENRLMIGLLRPHLRRVCQQARAAEEVRTALSRRRDGPENVSGAMVLLDSLGQVEFATASALKLLQIYGRKNGDFADGVRSPLPGPVARWFKQQARGDARAPYAGQSAPFWTVRHGSGELRLDLIEETSLDGETWKPVRRWLLKLSERPALASAEPLRQLGLSAREAEVLLWLAYGKRNAEIGSICRLRTTTVSTHLRNIFPKLGVETRTAAAALAWQTLATGSFQSPA
jgi:DNA-binding CsgD family transcriptional regulator